jgi:Ser/Thr protein kinase RdoA (MazF antagonist)
MNHEHPAHSGEDLLDLNEIMRAFGISEWQQIGIDETARGLSLLIEAQGQCLTLRERPEGMLGEDLSHRYQFRQYLQQAGIPIPVLRLTTLGEPALTLDEETFELEAAPVGQPFSSEDPCTLIWTEAAGHALAQLHQASQNYPELPHHWPTEAHMGAMVQGWLNVARTRAEEQSVQAVGAALNDCIEHWEAVLPRAMVALGSGGALPELHIHGDFQPLNLRFDDVGVTAVLGLEASHWEKRIFEIAYALFSFSALAWRPGESLTRPLVKRGLEPERARRFLRGYARLCSPIGQEASLLADALTVIAPIVTINGPLEDLFYAQDAMDESLIEDVLERLSWAATLPSWLGRVRGSLAEMWGLQVTPYK